jgi:Domain of unknown function (DUF4382)/Domain of unknown function (DUF5666)
MRRSLIALLFATAFAILLSGCGGSGGNGGNGGGGNQTGSIFIAGEDAPLPSVVSFNITIKNITLNNGSTAVQALAQPATVDFGRLMGLRTLLAFNTIPAGTYTSATFTLASPSISYVDMTTSPPSLNKLNGTLTSSTVTVAFPANAPMVVTNNSLSGLHMDFSLRKSLAVDGSGNITGTVTPVIDIAAVSASDELGKITEFVGTVLSVDTASNTFRVQGPYGFQLTIAVNNQTQYNATFSLAAIPLNAIVALQGMLQADGSILASNVEVITTNQAFISGRVLAVAPGPIVTMFVGEELPDMSPTIPVDSVYTVDLSSLSSSQYKVCFFGNLFTQALFNSSSFALGQRIFVGGTYQSSTFTPEIVSLRLQGVWGAFVQGSVSVTNPPNQGDFQMQNDALMGYAYASNGGKFPVKSFNGTAFLNIDGLSALQAAGATNLVTVGLVFRDQTTGGPYVAAGVVAVRP